MRVLSSWILLASVLLAQRPTKDEALRAMVFDVMVKQLGHRPSEAAQLIAAALGRRPGMATPEELFDEIYRGTTR